MSDFLDMIEEGAKLFEQLDGDSEGRPKTVRFLDRNPRTVPANIGAKLYDKGPPRTGGPTPTISIPVMIRRSVCPIAPVQNERIQIGNEIYRVNAITTDDVTYSFPAGYLGNG